MLLSHVGPRRPRGPGPTSTRTGAINGGGEGPWSMNARCFLSVGQGFLILILSFCKKSELLLSVSKQIMYPLLP